MLIDDWEPIVSTLCEEIVNDPHTFPLPQAYWSMPHDIHYEEFIGDCWGYPGEEGEVPESNVHIKETESAVNLY